MIKPPTVYVAYIKKNGSVGWIASPKAVTIEDVYILFDTDEIRVGVREDRIFSGNSKKGSKLQRTVTVPKHAMVDACDNIGLPWTRMKDLRWSVFAHGHIENFLVASICLSGPLPYELASKIEGTRTSKPPLGRMVRYGG